MKLVLSYKSSVFWIMMYWRLPLICNALKIVVTFFDPVISVDIAQRFLFANESVNRSFTNSLTFSTTIMILWRENFISEILIIKFKISGWRRGMIWNPGSCSLCTCHILTLHWVYLSISNYILTSIPKYFALKDSKVQIRIVLGYVLGN